MSLETGQEPDELGQNNMMIGWSVSSMNRANQCSQQGHVAAAWVCWYVFRPQNWCWIVELNWFTYPEPPQTIDRIHRVHRCLFVHQRLFSPCLHKWVGLWHYVIDARFDWILWSMFSFLVPRVFIQKRRLGTRQARFPPLSRVRSLSAVLQRI